MVGWVVALFSVIASEWAENMPSYGKRKKFVNEMPDRESGRGRALPRCQSGRTLIENEQGRATLSYMKRNLLFAAVCCSAGLLGCADSSDPARGSATDSESGAFSSQQQAPPDISPAEPSVSADSSTAPRVDAAESAYPTPAPSKAAPAAPEGEPAPPEPSASLNEPPPLDPTPKPDTGDDANPDQVNPRQ